MSRETVYELLGIKPFEYERYERNTNDCCCDNEDECDIDDVMKLLENLFDD